MYVLIHCYITNYARCKSIYNCQKLHVLHQKGIPLTFPKDPIDELSNVLSKKKKLKKLSFLSLPTAIPMKSMPIIYHCRFHQLTFCRCKPTHYAQNFQLDTSTYRQIQIRDLSKIYSNY